MVKQWVSIQPTLNYSPFLLPGPNAERITHDANDKKSLLLTNNNDRPVDLFKQPSDELVPDEVLSNSSQVAIVEENTGKP